MIVLLPQLSQLPFTGASGASLVVSYWPVLLGAAAVVSGITKFYIDLLDIQKKQAETAKLLAELRAQQPLVHRPTPEEIERYGRISRVVPTRPSLTPFILALLCLGLGIVAQNFQSQAIRFQSQASHLQAQVSQQKYLDAQVHALENEAAQLRGEVALLRKRNRELEETLAATDRPQRILVEENLALRRQITEIADQLQRITNNLNRPQP